jgi:hypothetical protein
MFVIKSEITVDMKGKKALKSGMRKLQLTCSNQAVLHSLEALRVSLKLIWDC